MSCYIYFYLKKKDTPEKVCLAHLCTSDARELSDGLEGVTYNVCYGGGDKPLTKELLDNTITFYDSQVQEMKESKIEYQKELEEAKELYLKATSELVLNDIKETISSAERMISWCDEESERFEYLKYYIMYAVRDVLEENDKYIKDGKTNDYELVYYMG